MKRKRGRKTANSPAVAHSCQSMSGHTTVTVEKLNQIEKTTSNLQQVLKIPFGSDPNLKQCWTESDTENLWPKTAQNPSQKVRKMTENSQKSSGITGSITRHTWVSLYPDDHRGHAPKVVSTRPPNELEIPPRSSRTSRSSWTLTTAVSLRRWEKACAS